MNRRLSFLILFSLISFNSFSSQTFKKIEDIDIGNEISDELTDIEQYSPERVTCQIVLKMIGNMFLMDTTGSLKENTSTETDSRNIDLQNRSLERYSKYAPQLEARFKFNLYDGIRLYVPIKMNYSFGYLDNAIKKVNNEYTINKINHLQLGVWFDWNSLPYMKLGIRGGLDDTNGYFLSVKSKNYLKNDGDQRGFDILNWKLLVFCEFILSRGDWLYWEPEVRFIFANENSRAKDKDIATLFYVTLLTPLKFEFKPYKNLKLKNKIELTVEKAFTAVTDLGNAFYGSDSGFRGRIKESFELQYTLFKGSVIKLPIYVTSTFVLLNEIDLPSYNKVSVTTSPNFEYTKVVLDNLEFIFDFALNYDFVKVSFKDTVEVDVNNNFGLNWGIGLRYDPSI